VKIINHSPKPVRLLYATSRQPWLTVRVPAEPIPAGGEGEVAVVVKGIPQEKQRGGSASIAHDLTGVSPLSLRVQFDSRD
jgi:hypothetical protein